MKLLGFFRKRVKPPGLERPSNPYGDLFSTRPSSPTIVHRIELNHPVVDNLLEIEHLQLIEAFSIIDQNRDGKISMEELKVMWKVLGEKVTDEELRLMVQEADANGDGEIDLGEFYMLNKGVGLGFDDHSTQAENIRLIFSVADADRNGHISADELQAVMNKLGKKKVTLLECSAMVKVVDSDGDNKISFQEFERLMISSVFSGH